MKISICGSMQFSGEIITLKNGLEDIGHFVNLPKFSEEYAKMDSIDHIITESARNKIEHDLIRKYFEVISGSDAVLVANLTKNGVKNYIGGNSFLEMGFAFVLEKGIYLLNPVPDMHYKDEILAMQPVVIHGDLTKIK